MLPTQCLVPCFLFLASRGVGLRIRRGAVEVSLHAEEKKRLSACTGEQALGVVQTEKRPAFMSIPQRVMDTTNSWGN
jgi:hypothetical protein